VPARVSALSAQLPAGSVPNRRMTMYWSGLSSLRHSASLRVTGNCGFIASGRRGYLIANGLTGEPTAPVIGMAGATNMNS
jgi:hypothetical protein